MKPELKQQLVTTLEFLKNHQEFDELTLNQIQERLIQYETLLIELVEIILEDNEDINGTMTTWWLFERVSKVLYQDGTPVDDVESPEDFINYMIERSLNL